MFDFFRRKKDKDKNTEEENLKTSEDLVDNKDTDDINEDLNTDINESDEEQDYTEKDRKDNDKDLKEDSIEDESKEDVGFFAKLSQGLSKTRKQFSSKLKNLFTANVKIDEDLYEELEEILISADIGMQSTIDIVDSLKEEIKERSIKNSEEILPLLQEIMIKKLDQNNLNNDLNIKDN